ncbi:Mannosylfructose-phosphate synthase [Gemmata obscuriglobus]|uniref:Glycosyl transferase family 1 n=1 Tax=Gemmata obscuriglobus TaxID=114 RepID=A0A2Z3H7Q6_9BACT|nr:glycosyltransferase family 4 protein [Gemmata obscuriglobus]AWM39606.1 glycosyl transferase family 1 [Gemmata obscuriglobus]QEG27295.1 Mannosylfructose-phosphate synthase [Gemmata obscuriglobus]VTS04105.1 glycosyl transferase family 1 : Glycosyltransferase OS=Hyalangium minutum GN=DB31_3627 PE=4 SV=1: Glyco_transf_4: Glycos_transf_1 [Gemmata obscuriglobus UQM 2246]
MDRANYALASYLARSGHAVELVTHRASPELAALDRVRVRTARKPLGSYFLGRWPLRWAAARAVREGGSKRVVANGGNFVSTDINWVHYVHAAFRPTAPASFARRLKGRVDRVLELRAERVSLGAARTVVCNSERTRSDVINRCGVDPERAVVVYYGTDPDLFRPATEDDRRELRAKLGWPSDRPVVMFIGALGDRRKGFDTLFAAWSTLCQESGWDPVLAVVGRGAELAAWEERARQGGLADRVRFLGFRSDVPDLLRAADALVAPTRYEAYGLGVHEALCCGLPALVTASAGVAERYPPELAHLLLPDPDDAPDLVQRLRRWRSDSAAVRGHLQVLSDTLRAFTWDDMGKRFVQACGA